MGKIVDKGIADTNNMGAAMAPAAHATITAHFKDTGRSPSSYDLIVTGDLGTLGSELLIELLRQDGIQMKNHADCGARSRTSTAEAQAAGAAPRCSPGIC